VVASEERRVLPDVPQQRQRDEVRERVSPERALGVDEPADPRGRVTAVDEDVAIPQVEVDQHGRGYLVKHALVPGG